MQNSSQHELATGHEGGCGGRMRNPVWQRPLQGVTPAGTKWPLAGLPGQSAPWTEQQAQPSECAELNVIFSFPAAAAACRTLVVLKLSGTSSSCHDTND